ncbi:hypothetical protein [Methylobacterium sp. J-090]|uniref:hypothetical protein n=1 Tax=Methylobacterium sp. J-090 TaxID=2836666 RepID=UPI001FBA8051|nr:hypothetical protein [Methylobacterium sp. J-090]MCJ2084008.1 hypothetical protein [Methylobacterium sp. J-090]
MPFALSPLRLAALMSLVCGMAQAADRTATLQGAAVIAGKDRPVTIRLACDDTLAKSQTGALSLTLAVRNFEALGAAFDFGAFEGPGATRKALSELTATGPGSTPALRSAASGSVSAEMPDTFELTVSASMRGDAKRLDAVRGLATVLSARPSTVIWSQVSPRKGDAPLIATVVVSDADSARIKTAVAPCLAKR